MSGLLAGKVWQSDLASHLKPLAAVLADIANDDGTSIYPSVAYMAWLLGKGRRSVQTGLSELKALGIIEALGSEKGGKGHTTEYKMIEEKFPQRARWRKGAEVAPLEPKGAVSDIKGRSLEHERAQLSTQRAQPTAPDPSVTVSEPLADPPPDFLSVLKSNPLYARLDLDVELARAEVWADAHRKRVTQRMFVNWLGRSLENLPLKGNGSGGGPPIRDAAFHARQAELARRLGREYRPDAS